MRRLAAVGSNPDNGPVLAGNLKVIDEQLSSPPFSLPEIKSNPEQKKSMQTEIGECCFEDSEFYQVRGGVVAEVIHYPFLKFTQRQKQDLFKKLRETTLKSFGKDESEAEIYASDEILRKNSILVDWLTLFRYEKKIIAYTSCSLLTPKILYSNASIVNPDYQSKGCFGILGHMYIWDKLANQPNFDISQINVVVRTRNRDVVNIMSHVLENLNISCQDHLAAEIKKIFDQIAVFFGNHYDANTGIAKNVYPEGLPSGICNHNVFFDYIFSKVGARDAAFVTGKINYKKTAIMLRREVINFMSNAKNPELGEKISCHKMVL